MNIIIVSFKIMPFSETLLIPYSEQKVFYEILNFWTNILPSIRQKNFR